MFPTIEIASVEISLYWLCFSTGLMVSGMLAFHHLLQSGYPAERVTNGLLLTLLGGAVGAVVINNLLYILHDWLLLGQLRIGAGISILGGLIGGVGVGYWYCRKHQINPGHPFDMVLLYAPLGQAIGRIGCMTQGCCYGRLCEGWLCLYAPDSQGVWANRYPTQLMSSIANLLIFAGLMGYFLYETRRRGKDHPGPFPGFVALLYICLYSTKRFLIEFLRGDTLPLEVVPLTTGQLLTLTGFTVALALILWRVGRTPT